MLQLRLVIFLFFCCLLVAAQHQERLDMLQADIDLQVFPETKSIRGTVTYTFQLTGAVDSLFLDAQNMEFQSLTLNGKKTEYSYDGRYLVFHPKYAKRKQRLHIEYKASPKQTLYFVPKPGGDQVWTQGQGKYTRHWLPSLDDMQDKAVYNLNLNFPEAYTVIASGQLGGVRAENGRKTWRHTMENPMSAYLLAFAAGQYKFRELEGEGKIPIHLYYYPESDSLVAPTYRYTQEIFDYVQQDIGVAYPWREYKQVPVHDFMYDGMENTGTTFFSDRYMIDSIAFVDRNYVNVNAHELAHQWFGNYVTELSSADHWLHEGFATFYAYKATAHVLGDAQMYWKLYDTAQQLHQRDQEGKGEALINPKASSLTFYEKGAWACFMLEEAVGAAVFQKGVQRFLRKHAFGTAQVADFIGILEEVSGRDLQAFQDDWLLATDFRWDEATEFLRAKDKGIAQHMALQQELVQSDDYLATVIAAYQKSASPILKERLVGVYANEMPFEIIEGILAAGSLKERQALIGQLDSMPTSLRADFESLLEDKSYITQEAALYKLWVQFPEHRGAYLEKTQHTLGLPNKNVRLLWLVLSLLTPDYQPEKKEIHFKELSRYTKPVYNSEVRQITFTYLDQLQVFTDANLIDLAEATQHHSWQFSKFARQLLDKLLTQESYKTRILQIQDQVRMDIQQYINQSTGRK